MQELMQSNNCDAYTSLLRSSFFSFREKKAEMREQKKKKSQKKKERLHVSST